MNYNDWIDSLRGELDGLRLQMVIEALKKLNPKYNNCVNLLLPNHIEIMKEVFEQVDHDQSKIVRRCHLVHALRNDEDVSKLLTEPAVRIATTN